MPMFWVQITDADQDDSPMLYRQFSGDFLPPLDGLFFLNDTQCTVKQSGVWADDETSDVEYIVYVETNSYGFEKIKKSQKLINQIPSFMDW